MATKRKPVDAVVIGVGWAGSILAKELTQAGLKVVGLEKGGDRKQYGLHRTRRARSAQVRQAS